MDAELVNNMAWNLRAHKDGEPFDLYGMIRNPRPKERSEKALPTLVVKHGQAASLDADWLFSFPGDGSPPLTRMSPGQFLSKFLTNTMWSIYPEGIWRRQYTDIALPNTLGERNLKRGAVQDVIAMGTHPSEALAFADHNDQATNAIYVAAAQNYMAQVSHTLDLPLEELIPQGRAFSQLDMLIEMRRMSRDQTALTASCMKPLVDALQQMSSVTYTNTLMLSQVRCGL